MHLLSPPRLLAELFNQIYIVSKSTTTTATTRLSVTVRRVRFQNMFQHAFAAFAAFATAAAVIVIVVVVVVTKHVIRVLVEGKQ